MLDFFKSLDYLIFNLVNSTLTNTAFDAFFFWITDLHKTIYFKIIIIPLVLFLFMKKNKRKGLALFFVLFFSLVINDFAGGQVKNFVGRPRPEYNTDLPITKRSDAGNYSFYSNHASNMFTFASFSSQFFPQIIVPAYTIASLVGYSRVYNGVHYPSDVFFGGLVGYLWGSLIAYFTRSLLDKFQNRKNES